MDSRTTKEEGKSYEEQKGHLFFHSGHGEYV